MPAPGNLARSTITHTFSSSSQACGKNPDGTLLGPYELLSLIGKGGMGEVYRPKIRSWGAWWLYKILPEAFAADTDRMTRFEREAKVLASLNHPHIAAMARKVAP
jgi:serine/threonine protein kinase